LDASKVLPGRCMALGEGPLAVDSWGKKCIIPESGSFGTQQLSSHHISSLFLPCCHGQPLE
jgi:hypothetical protein